MNKRVVTCGPICTEVNNQRLRRASARRSSKRGTIQRRRERLAELQALVDQDEKEL